MGKKTGVAAIKDRLMKKAQVPAARTKRLILACWARHPMRDAAGITIIRPNDVIAALR